MKLKRFISLSKHHDNLCNKVGWYSKWHRHPYHKHVHWLTFFAIVLFTGMIAYNSYVFNLCLIQADKGKDSADAEALADKNEKMAMNADKEEKDKEEEKGSKEEKVEEIINIEKIAAFIGEQAENINKVVISASSDAKALADKDEKDEEKNDKEEKDKKDSDKENENVEVCHISSDKPFTITISQSALQAHLDHGDTVGKCEDEENDEGNDKQDGDNEKNEEENDEQDINKEEDTETPPVEEPTPPPAEAPIEEPEIVPIILTSDTATVLDVTSPIRNNKYRTGPMPIYVVFSKPVEVIGSPMLSITTGNPSETLINYSIGSGTDILVFTYKIASGNFSSDLDYISINSLSLNGGSIKDADGNDASIILPAPGTAHSLGANKEIKIDTTIHMPTVLAPLVL